MNNKVLAILIVMLFIPSTNPRNVFKDWVQTQSRKKIEKKIKTLLAVREAQRKTFAQVEKDLKKRKASKAEMRKFREQSQAALEKINTNLRNLGYKE